MIGLNYFRIGESFLISSAVCWPGIPERKDEITKRCIEFWEKIKPHVPEELDNFVIDFAFLDNGSGECTIVEFNDFADFEGFSSKYESCLIL